MAYRSCIGKLTFSIALTVGFACTAFDSCAQAALVQFALQGKAALGLLAGNENQSMAIVGGSGGLIGAGIIFDDVTRDLTINVGWGSSRGFTNLTGNATAMHLHGPTASIGLAAFNENANPLIGLDGLPAFVASSTNGSFQGIINIPLANVASLRAGQLYINVHTGANVDGEIRGNLVLASVPEPCTLSLVGIVIAGGAACTWKRKGKAR